MKKIVCLFVCLFVGSANAAIISIGNSTDNGGGSYTLSSGTGSVSDSSIETFVGLSSGALDTISTGNATEGSALSDSFSIVTGDTFSFDWLWTSNEAFGASYNDFSFVYLSLGGIGILADTFTVDNTSGSFSWTATSSGLLTYGIGVMDVNDTIVDSFITVSNINTSTSVPEPASLALLAIGIAGFSISRKKKKA